MEEPFIVQEDAYYVVLYKPEKMHCAPLREGEEGTLLAYCGRLFPEVTRLDGKKKCEGGLMHRLDYETQGLVLFARSRESLDHFQKVQDEGLFLKKYIAHVSAMPASALVSRAGFPVMHEHRDAPFEIASAFRSFGPGRKAVRPVLMDHLPKDKNIAFDKGKSYITTVLDWQELNDNTVNVDVMLRRGFRHQIRSHLAWIGFPIMNDYLYGGEETADKTLALKAVSLSFPHPATNEITTITL